MPDSLRLAEARHYDRACEERLAIPSIVLMTHAAVECAAILRGECGAGPFVALCGRGNNGGDGYAIVRTLASHGLSAAAIELATPREGSDARVMYECARRMGLVRPGPASLRESFPLPSAVVLIDAIFGTGIARAPRGGELEAIEWINEMRRSGSPVYAIDVPSGLDAERGVPCGAASTVVRASRTLTMVAPKHGFLCDAASAYVGRVSVISIGGPSDPRSPVLME